MFHFSIINYLAIVKLIFISIFSYLNFFFTKHSLQFTEYIFLFKLEKKIFDGIKIKSPWRNKREGGKESETERIYFIIYIQWLWLFFLFFLNWQKRLTDIVTRQYINKLKYVSGKMEFSKMIFICVFGGKKLVLHRLVLNTCQKNQ